MKILMYSNDGKSLFWSKVEVKSQSKKANKFSFCQNIRYFQGKGYSDGLKVIYDFKPNYLWLEKSHGHIIYLKNFTTLQGVVRFDENAWEKKEKCINFLEHPVKSIEIIKSPDTSSEFLSE